MSNADLIPFRISWLAALGRGCSPKRWSACVAGMFLSQLLAIFFLGLNSDFHNFSFEVWLRNPIPEFLELLRPETEASIFASVVQRVLFLLVLFWPLWGWIGAWIARSELEGQHQRPLQPSPTQLVRRHLGPLAFAVPLLVFVVVVILVPVFAIGSINRFSLFGFGSFVVALSLPMLLLLCACAIIVLLGLTTFGLIPTAIATEHSDAWEGASRSLSYGFAHPIVFAIVESVLVAVASIPLITVGWYLHERLTQLPPLVHGLCWLLAAGLTMSWFWSLQTPYYILLRRQVDEIGVDEVHEDNDNSPAAPALYQNEEGLTQIEDDDPLLHEDDDPDAALAADGKVPEPEPDQLRAVSPPRAIRETLCPGWAIHLEYFYRLGPPLLGNALLLLAAQEGIWFFSDRPNSWSERCLAVLTLARESPLWMTLLLVGLVVAGVPMLARPLLISTRRTLISLLRDRAPEWQTMHPTIDAISPRPWMALAGWTMGAQFFLYSLFLLGVTVHRQIAWQTTLALFLTGLTLTALSSTAVTACVLDQSRASSLRFLVRSPIRAIGASLLNGLQLVVAWSSIFACMFLSWIFLADLIAVLGGEHTQWIRLGLDGRLFPDVGKVYWVSSRIAFLWLCVLGTYLIAYPLTYCLCAGTACYLMVREGTDLEHEPLELTVEEYRSLARP